MATKIQIEHIGKGWIDIFKSSGMQEVVDNAGNRIASNAGADFEYVQATNNQFTVGGFVVPSSYEGALAEATDKVLTKAVSR